MSTRTAGTGDLQTHQIRVDVLRGRSARIGLWIGGLLAQLRAWQAKRRTLVHLSDLSDWQLNDIGLTRSEAEEALRAHGFRRDHVPPHNLEHQR